MDTRYILYLFLNKLGVTKFFFFFSFAHLHSLRDWRSLPKTSLVSLEKYTSTAGKHNSWRRNASQIYIFLFKFFSTRAKQFYLKKGWKILVRFSIGDKSVPYFTARLRFYNSWCCALFVKTLLASKTVVSSSSSSSNGNGRISTSCLCARTPYFLTIWARVLLNLKLRNTI